MNPIENPVMSAELRFFLRLIFNLVVGYLVTNGYLDPGVKDKLVQDLIEWTGYLITLVTSMIGLYSLVKYSWHYHNNMGRNAKPALEEAKRDIIKNPGMVLRLITAVRSFIFSKGATLHKAEMPQEQPPLQQ